MRYGEVREGWSEEKEREGGNNISRSINNERNRKRGRGRERGVE